MKTKLTTLAFCVVAAWVWSVQNTVVTLFDGSSGTRVVGATTTNTFLGQVPGGGRTWVLGGTLASVPSPSVSNSFTFATRVGSSAVSFVFGGWCGYGTNYITMVGAGSNDANGIYTYAPMTADWGQRYTNGNGHGIYRLSTSWICTNVEGTAAYSVTVASGGVNGGTWVTGGGGLAPAPTSYWSDTNANDTMIFSLARSADSTNWMPWINVTNSFPGAACYGHVYTNVGQQTLGDYGWVAVYAGTNHTTNGAARTNMYLRAVYR